MGTRRLALGIVATAIGLAGGLASACYLPSDSEESETAVALPSAELAAETGVRRLTLHEFEATVALLTEDHVATDGVLPADVRTPFDDDYTSQAISDALVRPLEVLAEGVGSRLVADPARRDRVVGCKPKASDDAACFDAFVRHYGRLALRRPLTVAEVTSYESLLALAKKQNDFYAAVEAFVRVMLLHPEFLYRFELGAPVNGDARFVALNDFEIATKLSFLLLGRGPDDALLDRAAEGKLHTEEDVRSVATAMVKTPGGENQILRFFQMWLGYEEPPQEKALAVAMRAESDALVRRVVITEGRPFQDLLRSKETWADATLAAHYGLPTPSDPKGGWVSYGDSGRRGLLSHGSVLSAGAKFGDTSPTQRGKWVRQRLMCQTVSPPPPGLNIDEPPKTENPNACKKERYAVHGTGTCADCHANVDPIGFGLERFDQTGKFRTTEAGRADCPIDGNGSIAGVGAFNGPAELGDLLLSTGTIATCAITQVQRFMSGKAAIDPQGLQAITVLGSSRTGDFDFRTLLLDYVSSPSFRHRHVPE